MSRRSWAWAGGGAVATAAALATGVLVERRVVKARHAGADEADSYGTLRSKPRQVTCTDGAVLHVEVDEPEDFGGDPDAPTVVLVHGFALNLDCWHFQRQALRGSHRVVLFDLRSHGRSPRAEGNETIDQCGRDLASVITQVTSGKVTVVGHSMGGMAVISFAQEHPTLFADRVGAVALISTTAGGLRPHRVLSRLIPDGVGQLIAPRVVAALSKAPELVDSARRNGSNIGFLVAERYAFGRKPSPAEVEFLDEMLAGTPYEVLAGFFPEFGRLDRYDGIEVLAKVPTTVIGGTADRVTSIGHSRKLASRIDGARLVECEGSGHLVIFEEHEVVSREIASLAEAVTRL